MITRRALRWSLFVGLALLIAGCAETVYVREGAPRDDEEGPYRREVQFHLGSQFYRAPPECVTVLPAKGSESPEFAHQVERAVARYLNQKVYRVIGPHERRRLVREMAFDLAVEADRTRYVEQVRCDSVIQPTVLGADDTWLVVWAEKEVGVKLELYRPADAGILWRASHYASRANGGLPISPLSFGIAALQAGDHHQDADMRPSLVDDAVRRMMVTLPDVR